MKTVTRATPGSQPCLIPLAEAEGRAFMVTQYQEPRFHFIWHHHPEHELAWIRQGSGTRYVGGAVQEFKAGDLVLLGPNVPHAWASGSEQCGASVWTVFHFQPGHWGKAFWQLPEARKLDRLLASADRGLRFKGPDTWKIGQQIEHLADGPNHSLGSLVEFLAIFERLLETPYEYLNAEHTDENGREANPRMQRVLKWVHHRVGEPITQAQAARQVDMSPASFSRWFKTGTGRTFQVYLNELRIAQVCGRLAADQERITDIAYACGYSNLANFNRRFLQVVGITPTEFRSRSRSVERDSARSFILRLGQHGAIRLDPGTCPPRSAFARSAAGQ
jgi:AraC-like DNA-binding protein/quercetin dioxygenase-like cupin family protein